MTISVSKQFDNVSDGIQNMLAAATHDYNKFCNNENMQQEFADGWVVKEGQKYIKILRIVEIVNIPHGGTRLKKKKR